MRSSRDIARVTCSTSPSLFSRAVAILMTTVVTVSCGQPSAQTVPAARPQNREGRSYFLLFDQGMLDLPTVTRPLIRRQLDFLNGTPYDGVAFPLFPYPPAYWDGPIPSQEELQRAVGVLKERFKKDAWPVVYLNPIVEQFQYNRTYKSEIFRAIRGLALGPDERPRANFLEVWRRAARLAQETRSPGILFDPEYYNLATPARARGSEFVYSLAFMAKRRGEPEELIQRGLIRLGNDMADALNQEFPEAQVLMLFTGMSYVNAMNTPYGKGRTETVEILTRAMLDRALEMDYKFVILEGGETDIFYFNRGPEALLKRMEWRDRRMKPWRERYGSRLKLAAPFSP